ncbi:MAG: hypothetical protein NTZ17_08535 [Phycisphaerae bacterium]|nr:hypothetical protein [Phycisphaerae bacterium]
MNENLSDGREGVGGTVRIGIRGVTFPVSTGSFSKGARALRRLQSKSILSSGPLAECSTTVRVAGTSACAGQAAPAQLSGSRSSP